MTDQKTKTYIAIHDPELALGETEGVLWLDKWRTTAYFSSWEVLAQQLEDVLGQVRERIAESIEDVTVVAEKARTR